jgi:SAM-dependent methyltransferase
MTELYDVIGKNYAEYRRPDRRIAAAIMAALAGTRTIVNVGAGTGSYEPHDRNVVAVEPSLTMIRQRRPDAAPVVRASAAHLPFRNCQFDAALALLTVHHWPDQRAGLREMSRVAKRCVVFTWDHEHQAGMWLMRDYFPCIVEEGRAICPPLSMYREIFGSIRVHAIPIPHDCSDGFLQAYWRRPNAYLDADVRSAISAFAKYAPMDQGLIKLRRDLDDGTWLARNGHLLSEKELDLGYRLIVADGTKAA